MRIFKLGVAACLLFACNREDATKGAPSAAPTAPWAAPRPDSSSNTGSERGPQVPYRVDASSQVTVRLPAKDAEPQGTFRVVRGELRVDVRDLSATHGTVEVDLTSLLMRGDEESSGAGSNSERAKNWLNLGRQRPETEVSSFRTAHFTVTQVTKLSAEAAHLGKRLAGAGPSPTAERRRVTLHAIGQLELNARRTTRELELAVTFDYAEAARPGLLPTRIVLLTTKPLDVPLADYDVKPRDSAGRLLASDLDLVGRLVGPTARIDVALTAVP